MVREALSVAYSVRPHLNDFVGVDNSMNFIEVLHFVVALFHNCWKIFLQIYRLVGSTSSNYSRVWTSYIVYARRREIVRSPSVKSAEMRAVFMELGRCLKYEEPNQPNMDQGKRMPLSIFGILVWRDAACGASNSEGRLASNTHNLELLPLLLLCVLCD